MLTLEAVGARSLVDLPTEELNRQIALDFDTNFRKTPCPCLLQRNKPPTNQPTNQPIVAYRETVPYLLEQDHWNSTWTLCTGAPSPSPAPSTTQGGGAIYSMATAACRDNENTNVRFNELFLGVRVEVDQIAASVSCLAFSEVYEEILSRPDVRSCRVSVLGGEDIKKLRFERRV